MEECENLSHLSLEWLKHSSFCNWWRQRLQRSRIYKYINIQKSFFKHQQTHWRGLWQSGVLSQKPSEISCHCKRGFSDFNCYAMLRCSLRFPQKSSDSSDKKELADQLFKAGQIYSVSSVPGWFNRGQSVHLWSGLPQRLTEISALLAWKMTTLTFCT